MKRNWMLSVVGTVCVLAGSAFAEEAATASVGIDVPVLSAYVWRGMVLNDEAVVQPGLTGGIGGFSVNAWSSMDLTDNQGSSGEFDEMDWTVSYSQTVGMFELGAGLVAYTFPSSATETETAEDGMESETVVGALPGTKEVFVSVSVDVVLAPSLTLYYDIDEVEDFYAVASLSHSFELAEKVGLDLSASLGYGGSDYNAFYFGSDGSALNDLVLGASLPIAVTENLSVTPAISYMMLPDSDVEDAAEALYGEKDSVYGGVTLSLAF